MRSCSTLSTIRRCDGTVSSGMAEMLYVMMEHFTPADGEVTDNNYHKLIRAQNETPVKTEDKPFTTAETRDANTQ